MCSQSGRGKKATSSHGRRTRTRAGTVRTGGRPVMSAAEAPQRRGLAMPPRFQHRALGMPHQLRLLRQLHLVRYRKAGRHVFYTLDDDHVRDLFARFNADVRSFDHRAEQPKPAPVVLPPALQQPILHAYVEPVIGASPIAIQAVTPQPVEAAIHPNGTNWLFYLEVDHGVEDLAGITLGELEALRTSGILTIDDLLSRTVPQLQETTRLKGFQLSVDRLHALRGQAELTTRVPMLRRSDAALLHASGIRTVEELSRLRPETVFDRVSEFQRSESGNRYRRGGRLIDRQQAINWARFGQFTRSLDEARQNRSRFSVRSTPRIAPRTTTAASHSSSVGATAAMSREDHGHEDSGLPRSRRRRRLINGDADVEERRAQRLARRRRQTSRLKTETIEAEGDASEVAERSGGLRRRTVEQGFAGPQAVGAAAQDGGAGSGGAAG